MTASSDDTFIQAVRPLFRLRNIYRALWILSIIILIASSDSWFFFVAIVMAIVVSSKYADAELRLSKKVWERFAAQLDSVETNSQILMRPKPLSGVIGSIGGMRLLSVIYQGNYGGYDIRLLNQTVVYNPGSRNGSYSRGYRILEITTAQDFYHVFIDSKQNDRKVLSRAMTILSLSVRGNARLQTEGDVNRYFDIYIPRDDRYKSLVTLTPEKLLALREYGKQFDVEFVDNKIYVITNDKIRNLQDILGYQKSVLELVNNIGVDVLRKRTDIDDTLQVQTPKVLTF